MMLPSGPHAASICAEKTPLLEPADDDHHPVACHRFREIKSAGAA